MVLKVFSVYDSAVMAYKQPFLCTTRGEALRSWMQAVVDEKLPFRQSPGDYTLFELGEYDDQTGSYKMYSAKENLGTATEYLAKARQEVQ